MRRTVVRRAQSGWSDHLVTNLSWKRAPIKKGLLEEIIMLFMVTSRPKAGTTREQLIEHLTRRLHPSTWALIRNGVLSQVLYKVGDEPGFLESSTHPASRKQKRWLKRVWRGSSCLI